MLLMPSSRFTINQYTYEALAGVAERLQHTRHSPLEVRCTYVTAGVHCNESAIDVTMNCLKVCMSPRYTLDHACCMPVNSSVGTSVSIQFASTSNSKITRAQPQQCAADLPETIQYYSRTQHAIPILTSLPGAAHAAGKADSTPD